MRIVMMSDTHLRHSGYNVPDGDVLVHAGDFTMRGELAAIAIFGEWFRKFPHPWKVVVAGNHDIGFERTQAESRRALGDGQDGLVYLQDAGATIEGVRFWGTPWQPWFNNWAFNLPRSGRALQAKWDLIPKDTEVLISHSPPEGILDDVEPRHFGCELLRERVRRIGPSLHIFGHIHEGAGITKIADTVYVNASICDSRYRATNLVRWLDLPTVGSSQL
jgi:3',5'-cyclic AMP phosphodiesterase CpdA